MGFFDLGVFGVCGPRLVFGVEPVVFAVYEARDIFIGVSPLVVVELEDQNHQIDPEDFPALLPPAKAVETLKAR